MGAGSPLSVEINLLKKTKRKKPNGMVSSTFQIKAICLFWKRKKFPDRSLSENTALGGDGPAFSSLSFHFEFLWSSPITEINAFL